MSGLQEKQSPPSSLLPTALKLAGCGACVFAIAFGFAVFGTDGSVNESHADIAWISPFERSNSERFETALERLGHESPSRYNLNGNTVFFSTNTSRKAPLDVMIEYQEEFRRQGLNDRIYFGLRPHEEEERTLTGLTGGLVPIAVSDEQVILGGVVTMNRAKDGQDLLDNIAKSETPDDLFRAHRYIEITRGQDSRHTSIVSSWSDEAFNYHRMRPGSNVEGQAFDPVVPACPNCTRLTRFADENPDRNERVELAFIGPRSIGETRSFYTSTLQSAGWVLSEEGRQIEEIEQWFSIAVPTGESMVMRRGELELTLSFLPDFETGKTITLASYNN